MNKNAAFGLWVILLLLFFLLAPTIARTQETESSADDEDRTAVLLRGPVERRGLPMYPPNVISYYYGEYSYRGKQVAVFFVTEEVIPRESWETERCGGYSLASVPFSVDTDKKKYFYYAKNDQWKVFFAFPSDVEETCPFITVFIERLSYFINITRDARTAPLPAVLKLRE